MLAIVQARMSSSRLPGKVLIALQGRPILERVLERVSAARCITRIIVATSNDPTDDPLAAFCNARSISCYRGPLDDVAERFRGVIEKETTAEFVRISADSPLIDPAIIDRCVACYHSGPFELATNVMVRSFPKGQSVEVVRSEGFLAAIKLMNDPQDREHLTRVYYARAQEFRIISFTSGRDASAVQLSIDTQEDLERIGGILTACGDRPGGWASLASLSRQVAG